MKRTIWFDMDGTIANLYGVDNWLPMLREYNPAPYAEAEVMLNMSLLLQQEEHGGNYGMMVN